MHPEPDGLCLRTTDACAKAAADRRLYGVTGILRINIIPNSAQCYGMVATDEWNKGIAEKQRSREAAGQQEKQPD